MLPSSSNKPTQEATKEAPIVIQDAKEPQKVSDPFGKDPVSISVEEIQTKQQPCSKEVESQAANPMEPGEIPHSDPVVSKVVDPSGPSKDTNEDPLLLETDQGEDTDDGALLQGLVRPSTRSPVDWSSQGR